MLPTPASRAREFCGSKMASPPQIRELTIEGGAFWSAGAERSGDPALDRIHESVPYHRERSHSSHRSRSAFPAALYASGHTDKSWQSTTLFNKKAENPIKP